MRFSKQRLISIARMRVETAEATINYGAHCEAELAAARIDLKMAEIALNTLTAPDDIPRKVLDGICDMSDGGVNAQGIWDLCKTTITEGSK